MRYATALLCMAVVCGCGGGGDGTPTGPAVSSITLTLSATDNMASAGDTRTVTAAAKDASGTAIGSPTLTWASSSPSVATVTGSGSSATVTAISDGTSTISATSGSVQQTVTVTVARKFVSVALGGPDQPLLPGSTVQLTASARDGRGVAMPNVSGFTFSSGDASKVTVSSTGLATGITAGNAIITSTLTKDGVTSNGTATVTVALGNSNPTSAAVTASTSSVFTPSTVTIAPGGSVTWTFQALEHNVTFGSGAGVPANIPNTVSTSLSRTFASAGNFTYQCTLHGGMTGSVLVQGSTLPNYVATLSGANERPNAVTTNGAGTALFTVSGSTVNYTVVWSGLSGPAQMAHIHGPGSTAQAVGVLVDFAPSGQTSGSGLLTGSFTAANIRPQGQNPAISIDSLFKLMGNGNAYVNVHTVTNPGGEIRGQVVVP